MKQNIKLLVATGCSFTEVQYPFSDMDYPVSVEDYPDAYFTWPVHLTNYLNCKTNFQGRGASGNKIISSATIYSVIEALKTYSADEILVGVMWSGSYRHAVYQSEIPYDYHKVQYDKIYSANNPASIVGNDNANYYKIMPYWNDELSKFYYKYMFDQRGSLIETIEHILRVQWFLKLHNIKYFMTSHHDLALYNVDNNHPDVKYLWDEVDWNMFLPVRNEWDWLKQNVDSNLDNRIGTVNPHPTTEMNQRFTHEVIIPHLKNKQFI